MRRIRELYLIPFLHQTTTGSRIGNILFSCILFHFYIKPQLWSIYCFFCFRCILFHFYIKPQPCKSANIKGFGCILFHFYIKPQLDSPLCHTLSCCILFHFYIKPQQLQCKLKRNVVVSYSISTSNHNAERCYPTMQGLYLIPFLHQTTTLGTSGDYRFVLYLIPFLHQTTTAAGVIARVSELYLIPFLHQTTTSDRRR